MKSKEEILQKINDINNLELSIPRSKESLKVLLTTLLEWVMRDD